MRQVHAGRVNQILRPLPLGIKQHRFPIHQRNVRRARCRETIGKPMRLDHRRNKIQLHVQRIGALGNFTMKREHLDILPPPRDRIAGSGEVQIDDAVHCAAGRVRTGEPFGEVERERAGRGGHHQVRMKQPPRRLRSVDVERGRATFRGRRGDSASCEN